MNQEKLSALNDLFASEIEENRVQGASILVEHKGKLEFQKVYGGDKEDSIYKIYSMTKPITTVAVMQLYEKGLIDLYDPVDKYLPGFAHMKVSTAKGLVDAKSKITIRQLMNMTSGLVYPGENSEPERIMEDIHVDLHERAVNGEPFTNLDICNELAKAPLLFQPGEGWHYGISADIAAAVVEVVTGIPYGEYLKQAIFEPLEMKDTGFYVQPDQIHRLAVMYSRMDEEGHLRRANEKELEWLNLYAPTRPPYIESGGGGLYSTMEDYRHFVQMLLQKGEYKGRRIIGRKTVEFISKNQLNDLQMKWVDFDSIEGYGYGNFMRVMLQPEMAASNGTVGEYGWDGLPGTYFMIDPKEELMLIYMQQIQQGADLALRRKMRQIVYGALED
ncbi:MAG: beta-lactamase family protein [Lachnospiraceae bacterium]|nr:beta-lactamase family protein [Lachnospiraceae bacterium]